MGATQNIKPNFLGSSINQNNDCEKTYALDAKKEPDETLATVMMTRLHDGRVQTRFNCLLLMSESEKVSSTYPLNRKITQVGRSRRNQIRIKDPLVSVRHLTITVSGNTCVANDLESSNGTFINGERLVGGRLLHDGDEIMVGKTILRFAARQAEVPGQPPKKQQRPAVNFSSKKAPVAFAAVLGLLISAAAVLFNPHPASSPLPVKALTAPEPAEVAGEPATASIPAPGSLVKTGPEQQRIYSGTASRIQEALTDYAAGRLGSAIQNLNRLSTAEEATPVSIQARRILTLIESVRVLHLQAGQARKEKKLSKAIECWDKLLAVDMELVGERPSFYAAQAEKNVQVLTYEYALKAYRAKNDVKAKQLCQVVLQINPKHAEALSLLSKIRSKS
jgi:hypothetical protein